jgi:RNA polymerase sigma factor (sigma-70 family)
VSGTNVAGLRSAPSSGKGKESSVSDDVLLERFLVHQDEAAFATVVDRHGPMVLAVCRSRLNDPWDVEDAFQATFLKLVRSAKSIRRPDLLGHWLYRVAHHCALRTGQNSARHRLRGDLVAEVATVEPDGDLSLREIRQALFEEINQLGETYRAPVVLCYLEGMSHEEAARRLSWPLGTVKGRLSRARERLRERLTRRGLTLTAVLLALLALEDTSRAEVPLALIEATIRSARRSLPGRKPMPKKIAKLLSPGLWPIPLGVVLISALLVGYVALGKSTNLKHVWTPLQLLQPAAVMPGGCHGDAGAETHSVTSTVREERDRRLVTPAAAPSATATSSNKTSNATSTDAKGSGLHL